MRKVGGVLLAVAMLLPVGLIASPAGAAAVLTCTKITGKATFVPPVTPTASVTHKVTSKSTLSGCSGTKGITTGVATFSSTTPKFNCAQLLTNKKPLKATVTVKWNNGQVSGPGTLTETYVSVGVVKLTGKITKGTVFVGKTSTSEVSFLPPKGAKSVPCVSKGVNLTSTPTSFPKGQKLTIG